MVKMPIRKGRKKRKASTTPPKTKKTTKVSKVTSPKEDAGGGVGVNTPSTSSTLETDKKLRKILRPKSAVEATEYQRKASAAYRKKISATGRDIAVDDEGNDIWDEIVSKIDWDLRLACKSNLKLFAEKYLPTVFYLGWSEDQLRCVEKLQGVFTAKKRQALAMPRAGGKTALCRAGMLWGTLYAHRRFPFFIGSTQPKATQTLEFIKTYLYMSLELRRDFPEIAYPVYKLENRYQLARGQMFRGFPTHIEWGSSTVRYPCLMLDAHSWQVWEENDPDSLLKLPGADDYFLYDDLYRIPAAAGIVLGTGGIDGSIRGEAEVHKVTLEQPRPDVALLDDIQKDQKADSPEACKKLVRLIDGAVTGLSGPGRHIAALMPCTVTREGDVSDTYLEKPDWDGERCRLVARWPEGITDHEITLSTDEGKLWTEYGELRIKSYRLHKDIRLATEFYIENREKMDRGFVVTWEERFDREADPPEISAQQHAMNLRFSLGTTFCPEYQNIGRRDDAGLPLLITAKELREKTIPTLGPGRVPMDTQHITSFIDVQDEILYWGVLGVSQTLSGPICEYGTFPEAPVRNFTKTQSQGWGLLTELFFEAYPQHRDKAIRTESGRVQAPLEPKIYHALSVCVPWLLAKEFKKDDGHNTPMKIKKLGVDTRWGQVSDVIKRYVRGAGIPQLVPYYGQPMPPTNRQFEEYQRTGEYKNWLFEDQVNPQVKECKWVYKPDGVGMYHFTADVNRGKDFFFARLGSPITSPGSIYLYNAPPEHHELISQHICNSEYPEPVSARGIEKNQWMEREGRPDNEWLDIGVGMTLLATFCGAYLPTDERPARDKARRRPQMTLRQRFEAKRGNR